MKGKVQEKNVLSVIYEEFEVTPERDTVKFISVS